jgi:VWFA-related protein
MLMIAGCLSAGAVVAARQAAPPASAQPTFRAGTRLATIDAVVVDKEGRHVTDLTAADFEVVERGKRQAIRHVVYVPVTPGTGQAAGPGAPAGAAAGAPAPATPAAAPAAAATGTARRPTGRIIAVVVDDLGLSFRSVPTVRRMLDEYVETLAPTDLVAIIRTSGGSGALQQFTSDRRLLHAAAERVRYTSRSRRGIGSFTPITSSTLAGDPSAGAASELGRRNVDRARRSDTYEEQRVDIASRGTLGAMHYVLRGIQALPGRKSVVFVSEGFDLGLRGELSSPSWVAFTEVIATANRAGVVVYTLDPRGLESAGLTAEDTVQMGQGGADLANVIAQAQLARRNELFESQDSLTYMAEQTGGFAVLNTNDRRGLVRIADDLRGYYLIGVETSLDATAPWKPDDLRLRVTRPGLTLRARRGLFGPADEAQTRATAPIDALLTAAMSPFAVGAIDVRLASLFGHDPKTGSYVRSQLSIDAERVRFTDGPEGRRDADLNVLVLAVDDHGAPIAQKRWRVELRLKPDAYAMLRREGLRYSVHLPIKDPGGYQLRAAVEDAGTREVGTAAQFVEVPEVGKGRVVLSGVVVMDLDAAQRAAAGTTPAAPGSGATAEATADGQPAVSVFTRGSEVVYAAELYDGRGAKGAPLSTQTTLLRDGEPLYTTPPAPLAGAAAPATQPGPAAVPVGGRLTLGPTFPPGSYSLQISVAPANGGKRPRTTQWVDFEVR